MCNSSKRLNPLHVPVAYVDWFLNVVVHFGDVYLNLGTIDQTRRGSNGMPTVAPAAKLRMSRDFATRLHRLLGEEPGITPRPTEDDAPKNLAQPRDGLQSLPRCRGRHSLGVSFQ